MATGSCAHPIWFLISCRMVVVTRCVTEWRRHLSQANVLLEPLIVCPARVRHGYDRRALQPRGDQLQALGRSRGITKPDHVGRAAVRSVDPPDDFGGDILGLGSWPWPRHY